MEKESPTITIFFPLLTLKDGASANVIPPLPYTCQPGRRGRRRHLLEIMLEKKKGEKGRERRIVAFMITSPFQPLFH